MFGYVTPDMQKLSEEEKQYYDSCYCGICRELRNSYGMLSRVLLSYDMVFLMVVLSSVYGSAASPESGRCAMHPLNKRAFLKDCFSSYAADMNIILAYFNLIDDWHDSRNIIRLCEAGTFKKSYIKSSARYLEKKALIDTCLSDLDLAEKSGELNPDIPAAIFGRLTGSIFSFRDDCYRDNLAAFGSALGKFIYIMDACMDLRSDIKHKRYNPLVSFPSSEHSTYLTMLMADCTEKYKKLEISSHRELIENILYSGIWSRYETAGALKSRQVAGSARKEGISKNNDI